MKFFEDLIPQFKNCLKEDGMIAFLMSNYIDYNNPKESIAVADYHRIFIDNGFTFLYEIQCPLSTQQYQAHDVVDAKEKKKILIISRSLYIYGKIS